MGPKRKKSKPNPEGDRQEQQQQAATGDTPEQQQPANPTPNPPPTPLDTSVTAPSKPSPRSSWYTGGSWHAKASPVASIAKESISVAQGAVTSESSSSSSSQPNTSRRPSSLSKSVRGGSRKSIPLAAEATKVHAMSDGNVSRPKFLEEGGNKGKEKEKVAADGLTAGKVPAVVEEAQLPPEPAKVESKVEQGGGGGGWFGWWSRPDGYGEDVESKNKRVKTEVEEASHTPLPGTPIGERMEDVVMNARGSEGISGSEAPKQDGSRLQPNVGMPQTSSRSWFGLWSSAQNQEAAVDELKTKDPAQEQPPEITISADPPAVEQAVKDDENDITKQPEDRPKASGWAFWSSDKSKDPAPTPGGTQKQIGELAVADTPSQSRPEAAQFNEQRDEPSKPAESKRASSLLKPKRGKPDKDSSGNDSSSSAAPTPPIMVSPANGLSPAVSQAPTPSASPALRPQLEASSILTRLPDYQSRQQQPSNKQSQQQRPNLILPSFSSTFPLAPNPGYMERLTTYLASSLRLPTTSSSLSAHSPPPQHVYRTPSPPKVKKAVALGIHGFFPGALIQKFIGQPRGTSVRLANYAATAIKSWAAEHQTDAKDTVEVEKVALEGEGYIADRVATLWELLLNWLTHIRGADFILVACHSQGVPVAIMLVAKLIQLGCLAPGVRVGVCAMAGINLGPFWEYRSRLWGGTALELFEFGDPDSSVSRAYRESLEVCLRHSVRVTFVGSLDDQLVSLESALYMPLSHPYVNRAVFVDGRVHAPNFLTHLVVFALKLRNLGVSDHGLIRELSAPLAGSIVGGEGHSRVYDDGEVYRLAVEFALESTDVVAPSSSTTVEIATASRRTSSIKDNNTLPTSPAVAEHLQLSSSRTSPPKPTPGIPPTISPYTPPPTAGNANPFVLPWAVRGMLEEEVVKREMREEVEELVREFEAWRPTGKGLRDVRWRLEGVRGMV